MASVRFLLTRIAAPLLRVPSIAESAADRGPAWSMSPDGLLSGLSCDEPCTPSRWLAVGVPVASAALHVMKRRAAAACAHHCFCEEGRSRGPAGLRA